MKMLLSKGLLIIAGIGLLLAPPSTTCQSRHDGSSRSGGPAKPMTVPVTIRLRESKPEVEMRFVDLLIREDGEIQTQLSIRRPSEDPIWLTILIQDDLVSSISNEIRGLADFARHLPAGSHVMIGYIRSGSLDVRRKFTVDLEKAAKSFRSPLGLASASPFNPFVE